MSEMWLISYEEPAGYVARCASTPDEPPIVSWALATVRSKLRQRGLVPARSVADGAHAIEAWLDAQTFLRDPQGKSA